MKFAYRCLINRRQTVSQSLITTIKSLLIPIVALSVVMAAPQAGAQEAGSISGRVIDPASRSSMSGVAMRITETGARTSTARDGSFHFGGLPAGDYSIELSFLGLDPMVEQVTLAQGERLSREIDYGSGTLDVVIVRGIRGAQAAALNEQRTNDNISNVISADQLGNFPDRNIAEAMRRIPGVSVEREDKAGDGRYVSIRGLDSALNNFKLNGMNVAQMEEDNRRIPLDVIQVEAVSKIVVNKTLLPSHDGDGIGGAVELISATAFDYNQMYINANVEGFHNDFAGKVGGRVSGTFANVFGADDRWGFLISAAFSDRDTTGYAVENDEDWVSVIEQDDDQPLESGNALEVYDFGAVQIDNNRENIGINTAINYRASADTLWTFKGSFNELEDTEFSRGFFIVGDDDELFPDGVLAPEDGYTGRIVSEYEESLFRTQAYTLIGVTQKDRWRFDYSAGYSEGVREEPQDNEVTFEKDMLTSTVLYDRSDNEFPNPSSSLDAADVAAFADSSGWTLSSNDIDQDEAKDEKFALRFDATLDLPNSTTWKYFKTGFLFQRSDRSLFEANLLDADGDLLFEEDGFRGEDVNFADVGSPYDPIFAIDEAMMKNWRQIGFGLVDQGILDNDYVESNGLINGDEDTYTGTEDIYAGYVMAQADFGKWELIGGVRVEFTDIEINNLALVEDEDLGTETLSPITTNTDYTEVLPRMQVNYRASNQLVYRGAVFASLARPEFQYVAGTTEITIEDGTADIFLGNPDLEVAYSWNFDVGVEYYFGTIGILSANLFYKDIDNFIFNDDAPEGAGDASQFENDPRFDGLNIGDVDTYLNGNDAQVYGIELNYMQQFTNLDGFWGGFGTYANLTLQESEADAGLEGRENIDFFNAPDYVGTVALTYQSRRFEGSLAYSFRERFLLEFSQFQESLWEQNYESLDITLQYDLTDKISLTFRGSDILDDGTDAIVFRTFSTGKAYVHESVYNGTNITFGINATF
jgi:TonB-dependent receptor